MPSPEEVEKKLKEIKGYAVLFKRAFPEDGDPVSVKNLALAIGAYERTLVTPSPFDAFLAGRQDALDGRAKKGMRVFLELGCATCHSGPYMGGQMFRKFGLVEPYSKHTRSEPLDDGRYAATKDEADRFVFKVPGLRNVSRTPPYFHDGSVDDLEMAVWVMGKVQLGRSLSEEELGDIKAFLDSLTGEIPEDALCVPILPSRE
jgi:cytochrome c peroxidase